MYRYIVKNKGLYVGYVVFTIVSSVTGILFAFVLSEIINCAVAGEMARLWRTVAAGIGFVVAAVVSEYLYGYFKNSIICNARFCLKEDLFRAIFKKSMKKYESVNSAEYINNLSNNLNMFDEMYFQNVIELPLVLLTFIIAVAVCIAVEPLMLVVIVIFSVITTFVTNYCGARLQKSTGEYAGGMEEYMSLIKDDFRGFRLIRNFGITASIFGIHKDKNLYVEELKKKNSNNMVLYMCMNELIGLISTLAIMGVAAYFAINGMFEIGIVLAFGQISGKIMSPIMSASKIVVKFKSSKPLKAGFTEILETEERKGFKNITDIRDGISVEGLSFAYDNKKVLNDVTCKFKKGGKYAVVGASGSGKSTLLHIIAGYYDDYSGSVRYDDAELKDINEESIHDCTCLVSQEAFLFDDTLKNNITLYQDGYSDDMIMNAIKAAGLWELTTKLPDGLDTRVSEGGNNFSGGEKQRINLARVLLKDSQVLLFDEFTANLDKETAFSIEKNVLDLKDKTIIVVTHHMDERLRDKYDEIIEIK